jgi:hypothetical protein
MTFPILRGRTGIKGGRNGLSQKLKVGQSFLMNAKNERSVAQKCYKESRAQKKKFRCLPEGDQCRVWRIE